MDRWNIQAGELRKRLTLEAKEIASTDTRGHPVIAWSASVTNVSAKVETLTGRKLEIARELVPTATHLVTIRYRPGVDEKATRINYEGRIFNIGWINDVEERHVRLELTCTESLSPGA